MIPPAKDPMKPRPFCVRRVQTETYDTKTLELEPDGGSSDEFPFGPGQFNMVYVFGTGEVPVSISGDPNRSERLVHTVRAVGPVTRAICKLQTGEGLAIRGPFGSHWPVEKAVGNDVVIVTGGVGLPPLRPAIYSLLGSREKYGRIILLYGARTPQDMVYRSELRRWRGRFDVDVETTVDSAMQGWRGNVGVVTTLIPRATFDAPHTTAFVCGPEIMMRFTIPELQKRGVATENIFVSLERNMKCAVGFCGHCQLGPLFICKDGPVFPYDQVQRFLTIREI